MSNVCRDVLRIGDGSGPGLLRAYFSHPSIGWPSELKGSGEKQESFVYRTYDKKREVSQWEGVY